MPGLPTVGTPDSRRNSRPSRLLKTSHWPLVMHTGHVRYDQNSEPSKSVNVRDVGTPDPCRNSRPSELPTYVRTPDEPTREQQFYHCWVNTEHVRYQYRTSGIARLAKIKLALLSLKYSKLAWVGLSTYETLSINKMHPS